MASPPSIDFVLRDKQAETPNPNLSVATLKVDGLSRTISCGQSRRKGLGKLPVKPIVASGQVGPEAASSVKPEPTPSSKRVLQVTNDSIRQAISSLGTQTRKVEVTSDHIQQRQTSTPSTTAVMTEPVDWPVVMMVNSPELERVELSNTRSRSTGSAGPVSASNQPDNVRFDLEGYVRDLPNVRLALLSIDQYNYLRTLGDLGWTTDARVSLIDSQQVIFLFSETNDSMSALTAFVAITDPSDDEVEAATPTRPLSPCSNDDAIGIPVEGADVHNVHHPEDENNLNLDVPMEARASIHRLNNVRISHTTLVLSCIRLTTLLVVAAWMGAFGLWMLLAYDLLPNLYVAIERICLLIIGFFGREVVLWAFHFAVRKAMRIAASFIYRFVHL